MIGCGALKADVEIEFLHQVVESTLEVGALEQKRKNHLIQNYSNVYTVNSLI